MDIFDKFVCMSVFETVQYYKEKVTSTDHIDCSL